MSKFRIVIVDDSPFSISILKDELEKKGHGVVGEATSLEETIEVVKKEKPDLVTMDMTLPGTDGLECTREIHKIDKNIKVVIVSSMMDDEIVNKAKEAGALGYVQKPVNPEELDTVIERLMAREELFEELEGMYFDVFKESFSNNLNRLAGTVPDYKEIVESEGAQVSRGVSVVIGIIGKYSGRMIIDLSYDTAKKMSEIFLKRKSKGEKEDLAMSGEFANMVAGNACSMLNRKNKVFGFRVSPPTIFHGESLKISKSSIKTISSVIETDFGEIYFSIGFTRGDIKWM